MFADAVRVARADVRAAVRRGKVVALLLSGLALLAGCGQALPGTGRPASKSASAPLTSRVLGKLPTVDPCGLAAPESFSAYGDARVLARESFDACRFAVRLGTETESVVVELGRMLYREALGDSVRTLRSMPRGVRVLGTSTSEDTCTRYVSLVGGVTVEVSSRLQHHDAQVRRKRLCGVAKAGVRAVYRSLSSERVRHWRPGASSLANARACAPLSGARVAEKLGVDTVTTLSYPGRHECLWDVSGQDQPHVELDYLVGTELSPNDRAQVEEIAGRPTTISVVATSELALCTLSTEHIPFTEGVNGEFEMAVLRVLLYEPTEKDPCDVGRSLAERAWPELPSQ